MIGAVGTAIVVIASYILLPTKVASAERQLEQLTTIVERLAWAAEETRQQYPVHHGASAPTIRHQSTERSNDPRRKTKNRSHEASRDDTHAVNVDVVRDEPPGWSRAAARDAERTGA